MWGMRWITNGYPFFATLSSRDGACVPTLIYWAALFTCFRHYGAVGVTPCRSSLDSFLLSSLGTQLSCSNAQAKLLDGERPHGGMGTHMHMEEN